MPHPTPAPYDAGSAQQRVVRGVDSKPRVLIIDDEEIVRTALAAILEDEGYSTLQTRDGIEGLDVLQTATEPLIAVVDWMMPRLDGLSLLQLVAADPVLSRQHVYIMTSAAFLSGLRLVARLPRSLPVDVLIQPINITVFLHKIAHSEERLRLQQRGQEASGEHA
jgi:CheY-like chemotaxis protein